MSKRYSDEDFDAAMRALHASAVHRVSPQVRWKLRPTARPEGGAAGRFGSWRSGMLFAGAAAAVFAAAIGFGLRQPPGAEVPTSAATTSTQVAGVLDQDPDFYAWLASDDASLVAME